MLGHRYTFPLFSLTKNAISPAYYVDDYNTWLVGGFVGDYKGSLLPQIH